MQLFAKLTTNSNLGFLSCRRYRSGFGSFFVSSRIANDRGQRLHDFLAGPKQEITSLLWELIAILLHKTNCVVLHWSGVMPDSKLLRAYLSIISLETSMRGAFFVQVDTERLVGRPRSTALVVEDVEDTRSLLVNQIQNILIIRKADKRPFDAFPLVFGLLVFENKQVELLLESFVTVVDTQLFERVVFERFKAKDIQHSNLGVAG
mmetsp:Transcript_9558/g.14018  ORF Transcript_9558/g.14018 Transcript_9558/m.14018 type:complete len:206 (+) Transcript_9558:3919-4536(+)